MDNGEMDNGKMDNQDRAASGPMPPSGEQMFRALFESALDAIVIADDEGFYLDANSAACDLFGLPQEQLLGQHVSDFALPDHDVRPDWESFRERNAQRGDFMLRRPDGSVCAAEYQAVANFLPGQHLSILRDVTARRERERRLEAMATIAQELRGALTREETLDATLDALVHLHAADAVALALIDPESGEIVVERARGLWPQIMGLRSRGGAGITGQTIDRGLPFYTGDLGGEAEILDLEVPGERKWAAACLPMLGEGGAVGALWVVRQEPFGRSERRALEAVANMVATALQRATLYERLLRQTARFQRMANALAEGLALLDGDARILLANPAALRFLAILNGSAQVGQRLARLGSYSMEEMVAGAGQDAALKELLVEDPVRCFYQVTIELIVEDERTTGIVLSIRDVTEQREAETIQRRQERLAALGRVAAGIAHDFNNVITTFSLYTGILQQLPDVGQQALKALQVMQKQAEYGGTLVERLLDFSRGQERQLRPVDLSSVLQETVARWRQQLPPTVSLTMQGDGPYRVNADPTGLQQVFDNLLDNACDAVGSAGQIEIRLTSMQLAPGERSPLPQMAPGEWVRIEIEDTGPGIPAEIEECLFDPFVSTKQAGQGTGLGLAQVFSIVQAYGGQISVATAGERGTTFVLFLPLLEPPSAS